MRGKRTYGGRPGQRVEEQGTWAAQKHSEAGDGRPVDRGVWTANTVKRPRQQPAHPQYANYWAPLTRKRHTMPHPAQPRHTNDWAPRTRETTPARAPAAAADRKQRPDATCEGKNGVTVQGPVKKQQPDGMSHGGSFEPPAKGGGGSGKGALVTGQSQEASLKPLMMTHQLRREAICKIFVQNNFPHDTYLKMISASWGIVLSHICCGTSGPPPPTPPVSPLGVVVSPSGVPVTGAQKGGGVSGKGARTTPLPPARKPIFPCPGP